MLAAGRRLDQDPMHVLRIPDAGRSPVVALPDYEWPAGLRRSWLPRGWAYPDRFLLWRRRARLAALRSCTRPFAIFATFPPASAALLGVQLAHDWHVPLVLEYRDLWIGPGGYNPPTPVHRLLHGRLERRCVRAAAAIVAVSERMADDLAQRHGIDRGRVIAIPNGYEPPTDLEHAPRAPTPNAFTLAHVGTVIPRNRPDLFLHAVARAEDAPRWRETGLRIRFVGNLSKATTQRPEFAGLLESTGMIPADAARAEMHAADALLLLVGDYVGRWGHNAKLFDYLAAGRPILCLEETPGSNDRALLEKLVADRCVFASLSDASAIAAGINAVRRLADAIGQAPQPVPPGLEAYSRRAGAEKLAGVLTRACTGR